MPRPTPIRSKAKTKRIPLTYALDEEIAEIASLLMLEHDVHFAALRPFKIAYVLISGGKRPAHAKIDILATFRKVPPLWKALTGFDAIVTVKDYAWRLLDPTQRKALVAHELSHGTTNDRGELTTTEHDLEEFAWVARHFGRWSEGIKLFDTQLQLFEGGSTDSAVDAVFEDPAFDALAAARARANDDAPAVAT